MRRTLLCLAGLLVASSVHAAPRPAGQPASLSNEVAQAVRAEVVAGADVRSRILRPADGTLRLVVETRGNAAALADTLADLANVELFVPGRIQLTVPASRVDALARRPGVHRVRFPWVPTPKATSQGLTLMGADSYQAVGIDGSGTTVGVLDVGFPDWNNLPGDLPVMGASDVSWGVSIGGPGDNPHGTACAEIIHDLAPGASQLFANFGTDVEFETQLQWMTAQGADVISASIGWDNIVPLDGSGYFAWVVDQRWAEGAFYVAAAGNEGRNMWSGAWEDADGDGNLDVAPGDFENTLLLWDNTGFPEWEITDPLSFTLRWTDVYDAPTFDVDLEVYIADPADPLTVETSWALSEEVQDGSGFPLEFFSYSGVIPADKALVARIYQADPFATPPANLDVIVHTPLGLPEAYQVRASTLVTPSDSEHAFAVGAVQHSDLFITGYSSEGPTADGRAKPDGFGITHVSTESYGPFVDDQDTPGFNGTSAATPHVAALAALLLDETPSLGPQGIWDALLDNVDAGAIQGGGDVAGSGLINLGTPVSPGDDDDAAAGGDVEPNNGTADASPIGCGDPIEGFADDEDWFVFDNTANQDVTVLLNWTGSGDLDLYGYDATLVELDRSEQTNTQSEQIVFAAQTLGDYFVRVVPYEGSGEYWFTPECQTFGDDDDAADDDDIADDDDAADDDDFTDDDDAADDDDVTLDLPDDDDAADNLRDEGDGCQSCQGSLGSGAVVGLGWLPLLMFRRRRRFGSASGG